MNESPNILQLFPQQQGTVKPVAMESNSYVEVPYILSKKDGLYTWISILLKSRDYHYRGLVDAIISLKYDVSESFAIMLNYMNEPDNTHYKKEYEELQKWRNHAKSYAKEHFNIK